jgi:hypothetical protein
MAKSGRTKKGNKICPAGIAWAKRTFDRYPCVSMDSTALTKDGWKGYYELSLGDLILSYNIETEKYEWSEVEDLHYYEDAELVNMKTPQTRFNVVCTPNHKWVVKKTWKDGENRNKQYWHENQLIETKDIKKHHSLIVSAPKGLDVDENYDLSFFSKYNSNWVNIVSNMSVSQARSFFASAIVYDGHEKGIDNGFFSFGFSQKNENHGEACEVSALLSGYKVTCYGSKKDNPSMRSWHIRKSTYQNCQKVSIEPHGKGDVWCPQTNNKTWVMKQNGAILITGNSAYANMAASKYCKDPNYAKKKK